MSLFILGWLCGWGSIVVAGLIGGLALRLNRSPPPKLPIQLDSPTEEWHRREQQRILEECRQWREGGLES
jgi:hypothetical protein